MDVEALLLEIQSSYKTASEQIADLRHQNEALVRAGVDFGTPSYKQKKYLRIVRPASSGEGRQFEYIGSDPAKQAAALAAVERGNKFREGSKRLLAMEGYIKDLESELLQVKDSFAWSLRRLKI